MATTKKTTTTAKAVTKKTAPKKATSQKKVEAPQHIGLVRNDSWLEPFEDAIRGRHDHALWKIGQLTKNGKQTLSQFASGHLYFGLHKLAKGWVFREWAPNATEIYLIGDFNNWQESEKYKCKRIEGTGNWELKLSEKALKHGDLYKMKVKWNGEKENAYLHGVAVSFKTIRQRYSLHRSGTRRHLMSLRKRISNRTRVRC